MAQIAYELLNRIFWVHHVSVGSLPGCMTYGFVSYAVLGGEHLTLARIVSERYAIDAHLILH